MRSNVAASLLAVMLVACGGGGGGESPSAPPVVHPTAGTVLSSECDGYTLVREIADGNGGSTTERLDDNAECGYIPPKLDVTVDDTFADRFKPAVVTVAYTVQGEPAEWTFETDERVEQDGNILYVYGDGEDREATVLINDEPYLVQLRAEPRCPASDGVDCNGYSFKGSEEGLIYYGDDDTQVVSIELVVFRYKPQCDTVSELSKYLCDDVVSSGLQELVDIRINRYNKMLEQSRVYARFTLKTLRYTNTTSLHIGEALTDMLEGDVGVGLGMACYDTCGCAYPNTRFNKAGYGISNCSESTDIHEIGHAIGLAHGPENFAYPASGYLFPEFGHGWMDNGCNREGDLMSYNSSRRVFLNSMSTCDETFGDGDTEGHSGDRAYRDSAYHWNRVRYDLSLINDEHKKGELDLVYAHPVRPLVLD